MENLPNLLIVDDSPVNLALLEVVIKKVKVNLIQAISGFDALEKTRGIELALAIIDVRMPGMSGYELALKINAERSGNKVPVIFLTANNINEIEVFEGYDNGAVDYIIKPIDNYILLSKINIFIELFNHKQVIIRDASLLKKSADELLIVNEALTKSEKIFRSYIDNAPDGVFVKDETGRYLEVNEAACRITGYAKNELLKMSISDLLPTESLTDSLNQFKGLIKTGASKSDYQFIHKSGTKRWLSVDEVKLSNTRFLGFAKDITERKKAEAEIQKWANIFKNVEWGVAAASGMGMKFEIMNPAFAKMHGFTVDELNEKSIIEIFSPEVRAELAEHFRIIHETGHHIFESMHIRKDGSVFPVLIDSTAIKDDTGKILYRAFNVQDITERRKAEEELKNSLEQLHQLTQYIEKVRESERVAISRELHDDLGQALTAVKIDLGSIRQSVSDSEVILKINKVSALVSDTIKTVQRLTSQLRPEIIDDLGLEAAIDWYTKEFAERNSIKIFLDIDEGISISPDASLIIFRIMQESLTNISRHAKASKIEIGLSQTQDSIDFSISDDGIGITEKEIKSKKSFGIISMMERAASLGGNFYIYAKNDNGTAIKLTLPKKNNDEPNKFNL